MYHPVFVAFLEADDDTLNNIKEQYKEEEKKASWLDKFMLMTGTKVSYNEEFSNVLSLLFSCRRKYLRQQLMRNWRRLRMI